MLNAANVLFGRDPTMHHMQCMVRMARFAGTTKREFLDQAINEGNLFAQYDAILDFCTKHLLMAGNMDGKVRIDTLTVPYPVLREAAINMLVHRSWNADNLTQALLSLMTGWYSRIRDHSQAGIPGGVSLITLDLCRPIP